MSQGRATSATLGDLVSRAASWNPAKDGGSSHLRYIDLGSVDNDAKAVTGHQLVIAAEAPSRARQLVKAGDILVSTVRPNLNGVARVPPELDGATASTGFTVLRTSNRASAEYLFQWVRGPAFIADMMRKATGQSYPAVSDRIIFESEIPLPPLAEQRRIAAILDQADDLRRKRRDGISGLNRLTDAIFEDMFGDPRVESSVWPTVGFDQACRDETSKSEKLQRGNYLDEGVFPVIDQGQSTIAGWADEPNLVCQSNLPVVVFGDHTRSVKFVDFPFVIGADGAKILAVMKAFVPLFFAHLLKRLPLPDLGYSRHMREVKRLMFPCPPLARQREFADRVSAIEKLAKTQNVHLAELDSLFLSLQHRAFSGGL